MDRERVLVAFDAEGPLLDTCRAAREADIPIEDAWTPYAVHGLDAAMGLRPTRLGFACFVFGALGLVTAIGFQLWASVVDWPMNIGGKSHAAVPALVPITFEVTILFAALGSFLTIFARARLWPGKRPSLPAPRVTDDRFILALSPPPGREKEARELARKHGGEPLRGETP